MKAKANAEEKDKQERRECIPDKQSNSKAQQQIHNSHLSDGAGESELWW